MDPERERFFRAQDLELSTMERQATTLQQLLNIRAFNSKWLREHTVGSAVGVRNIKGKPTENPAIIAFVPSKVARKWVPPDQMLPRRLYGRGSLWCDLDVMEFNPVLDETQVDGEVKDSVFNILVEELRGGGSVLGPGSQVASGAGMYSSMGPLVAKRGPGAGATPGVPTGFLTTTKIFDGTEGVLGSVVYHPQTPLLGTGVEVGVVADAVAALNDAEWFGVFVCEETGAQVHVDAAYVQFPENFDVSGLRRLVGLPGKVGPCLSVEMGMSPREIVGKRVAKVGRTTGLTYGVILAYGLEYYLDEESSALLLDFVIEAEGPEAFSDRGDSGAMVLVEEHGSIIDSLPAPDDVDVAQGTQRKMAAERQDNLPPSGLPERPGGLPQAVGRPSNAGPLWRPLALTWAFSSQCGRSHYGDGLAPSFWSSAIDLGRVLKHMQLELVL